MSVSKKRSHSIKLPQLYREAAKVLQAYSEKRGSIRNLVYSTRSPQLYGRLLALLSRVDQHWSVLSAVLASSRLLIENPRLNEQTARVLVTELLWGSGRLPTNQSSSSSSSSVTAVDDCVAARPVLTVCQYATTLRQLASEAGAPPVLPPTADNWKQQSSFAASLSCRPRYVRVNTLLASLQQVTEQLCQHGWQHVEYDATDQPSFVSLVKTLSSRQFVYDLHLNSVLVFGHGAALTGTHLYSSGQIVMQDKASCVPACVLNPEPGEYVIDACAAPGMKTSHLSALMNNTGTLVAIERDAKRMATLNAMLSTLGVSICRTVCQDFLDVSPQDHDQCTAILVDPSCSGTGMCDRPRDESAPNSDRLRRLSNLQSMLVRHALSFPSVQRVVYSTCSTTVEENEQVVGEILAGHPQWKLARIGPPLWRQFGDAQFSFSQRCLRTNTEHDLCCGFFVAMFRRRKKYRDNGTKIETDAGAGECLSPKVLKRSCDVDTDGSHQTGKQKKRRKTKESR